MSARATLRDLDRVLRVHGLTRATAARWSDAELSRLKYIGPQRLAALRGRPAPSSSPRDGVTRALARLRTDVDDLRARLATVERAVRRRRRGHPQGGQDR
jgi:hypothetical protein